MVSCRKSILDLWIDGRWVAHKKVNEAQLLHGVSPRCGCIENGSRCYHKIPYQRVDIGCQIMLVGATYSVEPQKC